MTALHIESLLRMARAYAADQLPWFAPALFSARLQVNESCPALAAIDDHMRVYFNPAIAAELVRLAGEEAGLRQLAWVWVHEMSHAVRDHGERARERKAEPTRWNVAADLEINDADWPGMEPPQCFPPLLPATFGWPVGKLAEFYYNELAAVAWADGGEAVAPDEGSGVHGRSSSWELPADDHSAPAVTPLEKEAIRQQVAESMYGLKQRGTVPGGWQRWAEQFLNPRVNWRELLKKRIRGAVVTGVGGRLDYSFERPHRRAASYVPLVRPTLNGDLRPRVACVVDTSGSMSNRELSRCLAEVWGVLDSLRTPVVVVPCDAQAYEPIDVQTRSDYVRMAKQLRGGGGTNLVAGIEAAFRLRPQPDVVIVLTDGLTPFPTRRYKSPVIFGILTMRGNGGTLGLHPNAPWRREDFVMIEV